MWYLFRFLFKFAQGNSMRPALIAGHFYCPSTFLIPGPLPRKKAYAAESILSFQRGEESGLNYFFHQYYLALTLFSYNLTANKESAEEIAEDAFLKLWERHQHFSHPSAIRSFLYITVKNASLNWIRQQKRDTLKAKQLVYLSDPGENHILQKIISAEVYQEVFKAINALPPKCRRIFQMLFVEGKDYQQIAKELKLSVSTIHNQKARGIELLKRQLKPVVGILVYFFLFIF